MSFHTQVPVRFIGERTPRSEELNDSETVSVETEQQWEQLHHELHALGYQVAARFRPGPKNPYLHQILLLQKSAQCKTCQTIMPGSGIENHLTRCPGCNRLTHGEYTEDDDATECRCGQPLHPNNYVEVYAYNGVAYSVGQEPDGLPIPRVLHVKLIPATT